MDELDMEVIDILDDSDDDVIEVVTHRIAILDM